jgi:hypothetical protein
VNWTQRDSPASGIKSGLTGIQFQQSLLWSMVAKPVESGIAHILIYQFFKLMTKEFRHNQVFRKTAQMMASRALSIVFMDATFQCSQAHATTLASKNSPASPLCA